MNEVTLELDGMTCGACEKIISRIIEQNGATIKEIDAMKGFVKLLSEEQNVQKIKEDLSLKGFKEKGTGHERGDHKMLLSYVKSLLFFDNSLQAEAKIVNYSLGALITVALISTVFYFVFVSAKSNAGAFLPLIIVVALTSALLTFVYNYMASYKKRMSCTLGMMVGMTIGMVAGFLVGEIIGATNGMFLGSVTGLVVGTIFGVNIGRCCGIMGAMEGIMAGFMGGIMGAMTTVMMINDNLVVFVYISFMVCAIIVLGLGYMMFRETGAIEMSELNAGFSKYVLMSAAILIFLLILMVFAPRGPLSLI